MWWYSFSIFGVQLSVSTFARGWLLVGQMSVTSSSRSWSVRGCVSVDMDTDLSIDVRGRDTCIVRSEEDWNSERAICVDHQYRGWISFAPEL